MTHNNISYLEVLEKKRSNLAQEAETQRANRAKEAQNRYSTDVDAEVRREVAQVQAATNELVAGINRESQAAVAQISAGASMTNARINAETQRYATDVSAGLRQQEIDETGRHNIVSEDVAHTANVINSVYQQGKLDLDYARLEQDDYYRGIAAEQNQQSIDNALVVGSGGVLARLAPALAGLLTS